MGTFGEIFGTIELADEEDAAKVKSMIERIDNIVSLEQGKMIGFGISEIEYSDDNYEELMFTIRSSRCENAQWQAEQIVDQLKKMIEREEIKTVIEFKSTLMVESDSIYLDEDDFKIERSVE